ncbi:MAG: hypothetical protein HYX47_11410 [Burkholderiales bacterium]|nr:hypothetical protein [Burkholderiales bacterium]
MHSLNKTKLERAAGDVRRLQAALDARCEAAPDNALELEMIAGDLRRATLAWRRLMQEVLAPREIAPLPVPLSMPARNPLELPAFAGFG